MERHKLRVQHFDFRVEYRPGSNNPTDYNSRHPLPDVPEEDEEVYINSVVDSNLPDAITLSMLQRATNESDTLAKLKYCIMKKGFIPQDCQELKPYQMVFNELSIVQQLILRGNRIVVPKSLQASLVELGHIGHQGVTKVKQYLRSRVWFPKMDSMIEEFAQTCLSCQTSTPANLCEPDKTSEMPQRPWQYLAMDFKGPIGQSFYFFLVIDEFSKFPEVEIVESTAADEVLPKLDRILGTHGIPEKIKSDNGPPFNSHDMKEYAQKRGFVHQKITREHPKANGLAENFMRMLRKVAHTAIIEHKDPKEEVHKYLMNYRATPHSTTGKSPAEMLFGRPLQTSIPVIDKKTYVTDEMRRNLMERADKSKKYNDARRNAKPSKISEGDMVLAKQKKSTTKPFFDPEPYKVESKKGSMIIATRGKKKLVRDSSRFKKITLRPKTTQRHHPPNDDDDSDDYDSLFSHLRKEKERGVGNEIIEDSDSEATIPYNESDSSENEEMVNVERRYPKRQRNKPTYLEEYNTE